MVERCERRLLTAGDHVVYVTGFQAGGGVGMEIKYSGPDTNNAVIFMRVGQDALAAAPTGRYFPKCDPSSPMADETKFTMCMFRSVNWLGSIPAVKQADQGSGRLYYLGKAKVPVVDFHDVRDLRSYIPATPDSNYAWAIFGRLVVVKAGNYQLCTVSDDGCELGGRGVEEGRREGERGVREWNKLRA